MLKVSFTVDAFARFSAPELLLLGPARIEVPPMIGARLMICDVNDAIVYISISLVKFCEALVSAPYATVVLPSVHLYVTAVLVLECVHRAEHLRPCPATNVLAGKAAV